MNQYTLVCPCGAKTSVECDKHAVWDQKCSECGKMDLSIDRSDIKGGVPEGRQYVGRQWLPSEQVWLEGPRINKADLPAWRKSIPSLETNHKDQIIFRSDKHQREVFKAMSQGKRDNEARRAQEASSGR